MTGGFLRAVRGRVERLVAGASRSSEPQEEESKKNGVRYVDDHDCDERATEGGERLPARGSGNRQEECRQ